MHYKPKKPCSYPNCKELTSERFCLTHKKKYQQDYDKTRESSHRRGYDRNWRKVRLMVLNEEPLCRECTKEGRITPATEVDHIDGNARNLWRENLQPLCKSCHSKKTAKEQGRWGN